MKTHLKNVSTPDGRQVDVCLQDHMIASLQPTSAPFALRVPHARANACGHKWDGAILKAVVGIQPAYTLSYRKQGIL